MFRNLIFDWSGTLCDDLALTLEATNYVLAQYGCPALTREQFRAEFQLPYPDYYAVKTPEAKLEELENHYRYAFDRSRTGVTIIPHAREFMDFCTARGIRCFALTSMDPKAFDEQSRELGIRPYFEHVHSGIHNKQHYIPTVMQMHGLVPGETAFIGDMQHDMDAAHCAGVTAIGVLTGYNDAAQLCQATPDLVVPDLAALRKIMERCSPCDDAISINGMELLCHIGVPEEERSIRQRLTANISIVPPLAFAGMGEDITRTVDYDDLARRLKSLAEDKPSVLLESLAHRLALCCTREFGARRATVELHKYILPGMVSTSVRTTAEGGFIRGGSR